jgi:peptide deformylase
MARMELFYGCNLWNFNNNDMDKNTNLEKYNFETLGYIYTLDDEEKGMCPIRRHCWQNIEFSRAWMDFYGEEFERYMLDTMESAGGLGLAANQLGFSFRAFAMDTEDHWGVIYNPEIIKFSNTKTKDFEGCLSIPDKIGLVPRFDWVNVIYEVAPHGMKVNRHFKGLSARVFQHELDHLNGVLISDYWTDNNEWALISEMRETWEGYGDLERAETTL